MTVVAGNPGILHQMIGMMAGREASLMMTTPGVPGIAAVLVIPGVPGMTAVPEIPGILGMTAVLAILGIPGITAAPDQTAMARTADRRATVAVQVRTVLPQIPVHHPAQVENLQRKGFSGG